MKALCQISASLPLPGICEQQSRPAACLCQRETRRGIKRRWEKVVAWREQCLCPSPTPLAWISTRELSAAGDIPAHPSSSQHIPAHPSASQLVPGCLSCSQHVPAHSSSPLHTPSHSSMCQLIPAHLIPARPSSSQHIVSLGTSGTGTTFSTSRWHGRAGTFPSTPCAWRRSMEKPYV